MAERPGLRERDRRLQRLHREQTWAWGLAWLVGVGSLFAVAATFQARLTHQDLDAELGLYSTAVYGLTWFGDDGSLDTSTLDRETDLLAIPFDLWIVEPGESPRIHRAPVEPRFAVEPHFVESLANVAADVVTSEEDLYVDGRDTQGQHYRLHGIPSFDEQDRARAAILVLADPSPWHTARAQFVTITALMTLALSLVGLWVGARLSRRSLRPVLDSFEQQQRFLAAAAHELRTPVGNLQAVCESPRAAGETAEETLAQVGGMVRQTGELVDQLLLLARLDADTLDRRQPVRLDLLVEALLPEDGSVQLEAQESVVDADPDLLKTAVRNLVENARRHGTDPEGNLALRVRVGEGSVVFEDAGSGFPAELLEHASEPFVARPDSPGTGLGLAIVRLIAQRHGGQLLLENRRPRGARLTLKLLTQGTSP